MKVPPDFKGSKILLKMKVFDFEDSARSESTISAKARMAFEDFTKAALLKAVADGANSGLLSFGIGRSSMSTRRQPLSVREL